MSILFEPKAIGNLVLKNRFIKSSTAESMAGSNGEVTPSMLEFYEAIARGMEQAVRATKSLDNLKISEWLTLARRQIRYAQFSDLSNGMSGV